MDEEIKQEEEKKAEIKQEIANEEKFIQIELKELDIVDALKLVAPGTQLRAAIDEVVKARRGALIVVSSGKLWDIVEGGFKINCKFTPQKLFELSKMDGAVIISDDLKRIICSNALLVPDHKILSNETGTRHKAAERTAKQAETLTIAISERRNTVKVFYHNLQYSLKSTDEILSRAIDKTQILEKQREIYSNLISNLNKLEVAGLVMPSDISSVLQRSEIILKIYEMMKKELIELGDEAALIKIRLKELMRGVEKDKKLILKDYTLTPKKYQKEISKLSFENLLDTGKIAEIVFSKKDDDYIKPKGYRILEKIDFPEDQVKIIINKFSDLNKITDSGLETFEKILKNKEKAEKFIKEIFDLRENILMEKEI